MLRMAAATTMTRESEPVTPSAAAAPPAEKAALITPKRSKAPFGFGGLLLVAGGIGAYLYISRIGKESTDDAQVEGHVSNVAARISGQVKRVLVKDNQEVKAGDVLVELDDRDQQVKLGAAQADLNAALAQQKSAETTLALTQKTAQANLAVARGGVAQAAAITGSTQAVIDAAKAELDAAVSRESYAKKDFDRVKALTGNGALSKSDLDRVTAAEDQAIAGVAQASGALWSPRPRVDRTRAAPKSPRAASCSRPRPSTSKSSTRSHSTTPPRRASPRCKRTRSIRPRSTSSTRKVRAEIAGTIAKRMVEPGQSVSPDPRDDGGRRSRGHVDRREPQGDAGQGRQCRRRDRDRGRHVRRAGCTAMSTASRRRHRLSGSRCCPPTQRERQLHEGHAAHSRQDRPRQARRSKTIATLA